MTRSSGKQPAERTAVRAAPIVCPEESLLQAARKVNFAVCEPLPGHDAPTPTREWDLPSHGALTLFFRWRKKSVQKKASGTATTGKRLLLPILTSGLAMSRAMELDSFHQLLERARARLFPPSKWAGLFPSAAYRRSAPPSLGWERGKISASWDASALLKGHCGTRKQNSGYLRTSPHCPSRS